METFDFPLDLNPEVEFIHQKLATDMGEDVHKHERVSGINQSSRKWELERAGFLTELKLIRNFVRRHKGNKPFLWITPEGESVKVKATRMSVSTHGAFRGRISLTFEESFKP